MSKTIIHVDCDGKGDCPYPIKPMKNLDYEKMAREIDDLVNTEFMTEMELKELPNAKPYTQEEALQMSDLLGKVYLVAHCVHCEACQTKYIKP